MPLTRIECPECGAGLKSPTGFEVGQVVNCPKCESQFAVEEDEPVAAVKAASVRKPMKAMASRDDDEPGEKPKKKKKRRRDDDDEDYEDGGKAYKNSTARYAILGVLVVVMVVLGVLLMMKWRRNDGDGRDSASNSGDAPVANPRVVGQPGPGLPMQVPGMGVAPGGPAPKLPNPNQLQPPPFQVSPFAGGGVFGGTPSTTSPEGQKLMGELSNKLVGTWEGTDADGAVHKVQYQKDGQFTHEIKGSKETGVWRVAGLVGTRGLKLTRGSSNATVSVLFEDDELIHDTGTPGRTVVLRKK